MRIITTAVTIERFTVNAISVVHVVPKRKFAYAAYARAHMCVHKIIICKLYVPVCFVCRSSSSSSGDGGEYAKYLRSPVISASARARARARQRECTSKSFLVFHGFSKKEKGRRKEPALHRNAITSPSFRENFFTGRNSIVSDYARYRRGSLGSLPPPPCAFPSARQ